MEPVNTRVFARFFISFTLAFTAPRQHSKAGQQALEADKDHGIHKCNSNSKKKIRLLSNSMSTMLQKMDGKRGFEELSHNSGNYRFGYSRLFRHSDDSPSELFVPLLQCRYGAFQFLTGAHVLAA